jgi:glycosyltransferase involved in cell wall biosynthesis
MRIGLNLLCILPGVNGGVETYSVSLLGALASHYPEHEFIVFVNRLGAAMPVLNAPNITRVVCDFDARQRSLRYAWEHLILPRKLRDYSIDVLHSPGYQGPVHCDCPGIVTLPDVNFRSVGKMFPLHQRAALRFFCERSARKSTRVITISQFSKSDIIRHLGLPEEKITVTPLACCLTPGTSTENVAAIYRLPSNYIVTFGGNSWPHKNHARLFEALELVREKTSLVIIGRFSEKLRHLASLCRFEVLPIGFVPSGHILPILGLSRLCVLPSLYEGFGLSVLEAQTAGTPLACSNAASLPEVAGPGARYFDPLSPADIASSIDECLSNRAYCETLVRAGRKNITRFSWNKTAEQTMGVYREVAGAPDLVKAAKIAT